MLISHLTKLLWNNKTINYLIWPIVSTYIWWNKNFNYLEINKKFRFNLVLFKGSFIPMIVENVSKSSMQYGKKKNSIMLTNFEFSWIIVNLYVICKCAITYKLIKITNYYTFNLSRYFKYVKKANFQFYLQSMVNHIIWLLFLVQFLCKVNEQLIMYKWAYLNILKCTHKLWTILYVMLKLILNFHLKRRYHVALPRKWYIANTHQNALMG